MTGEFKLVGVIIVVSLGLIAAIALFGSRATPQESVDPRAVIGEDAVVTGAPAEKANVTVVEFADFQCPACAAAHPTLKRLLSEYPNSVRFVYRNFPLINIHPNAQAAAYAAEAAARQDKFWLVHDWLFEHQSSWKDAKVDGEFFYNQFGEEFKLNRERFLSDFSSSAVRQKVANDFAAGRKFNVDSTPTFFVNGKRFSGARSFEEWQKIISSGTSTPEQKPSL